MKVWRNAEAKWKCITYAARSSDGDSPCQFFCTSLVRYPYLITCLPLSYSHAARKPAVLHGLNNLNFLDLKTWIDEPEFLIVSSITFRHDIYLDTDGYISYNLVAENCWKYPFAHFGFGFPNRSAPMTKPIYRQNALADMHLESSSVHLFWNGPCSPPTPYLVLHMKSQPLFLLKFT